MKRNNYIGLLVLTGLLCFAAGSCKKHTEGGAEAEAKEIVLSSYRDGGIDELDAASYRGPHFLYKMIYEGFVEDGGEGKIIPKLAESWDIGPDNKTYTFHLRKGIQFSDGTDFNADAVIFNMNRWINNSRHGTLISNKVTSMQALDEYTVEILFEDAAYPIITELTYPRPVRFLSPASVKKEGSDEIVFTKPIGTGPWMIDTYVKDQEFSLVPNPYYWGEKPQVDRILFKVITDGQARVLALQSGEIDILGGDLVAKIPMESVPELKQNPNFTTYIKGTLCAHFIGFNETLPVFQDKNLRLAMNYAINKKSIAENLFDGAGLEANGLYQADTPYARPETNYCVPYDTNKAIELLEASGYIDSDGDGVREKGNARLEFNFVFSTGEFPEWKPLAEFIQSEFAAVGIKTNLSVFDKNGYEEITLTTRQYDICLKRTASDSWVPHSSLLELFGPAPTALEKGVGNAWFDEGLYQDILKTLASFDETERQAHYDNVFGFISEEALTIPVYHPTTAFAVNAKKIENFEVGVNNYAPVEWEKLDVK
ncbi:MAG: ABC transporter substrate-binding protein [Treponema sp.]|jgi:peptide/nickel transport system substrate-binding protein|nr:ABC transporter substrate-binding protein [Treponema sp.]